MPIDEDFSMTHLFEPSRLRFMRVRVNLNRGFYFFEAKGKLYGVQGGCICVVDMDTGGWTLRHRYSFAGLGLREPVCVVVVTAVGDELVATVRILDGEPYSELTILESAGFGGVNIDITWHISTLCPSDPEKPFSRIPPEVYPIEL